MEKNVQITLLLDFYSAVLNENQKNALNYYYNEDLSLGEIAQLEGVTRQGVRERIKSGENILLELEQKLNMGERFRAISADVDKIIQKTDDQTIKEMLEHLKDKL